MEIYFARNPQKEKIIINKARSNKLIKIFIKALMTLCHFSYIKIHDLTRGFEQQCLFGRTEKKQMVEIGKHAKLIQQPIDILWMNQVKLFTIQERNNYF